MDKILFRKIEKVEYEILEDLLYELIYQEDQNNLIPREIVNSPEVRLYIDKFGERRDDCCLVAEINRKIAGAVWARVLSGKHKGIGQVDNQTPELSISLFKEYRGKGIGTHLMKEMLGLLKAKGYPQASLSVQKNNYAINLYKKLGFKVIQKDQEGYVMLLKLR